MADPIMATDSASKQQNPPTRSPSPPTHPPLPSAPGPRASALQKLHSDAIAHLLKTCSYAHFAACFPTPAREVPGSMRALHEQFTAKLGEQLRGNFEELMEEREAVGALNGLDGLVEEARRRRERAAREGGKGRGRVVPPHTFTPRALYLSHLAPQLRQYSHDMKSQQTAVQAENVELLARVQQRRKDITALVAGLENVVADLHASVAALKPEEIDELGEEVRDVDEGMRMEL